MTYSKSKSISKSRSKSRTSSKHRVVKRAVKRMSKKTSIRRGRSVRHRSNTNLSGGMIRSGTVVVNLPHHGKNLKKNRRSKGKKYKVKKYKTRKSRV